MKKTYEFVAVNGRPAASVSVTVYNYGTANLATLYSDSAGTLPITNPVVTDVNGYYEFYAADGRYSLAYSGTAITPRTLTDLIIDDTLNPVSADAARVGADDGASGSIWTTVQGFINKIISSVGSAYVGFIQSGTGAVATTVQEELRQRRSVTQFGAEGDLSADDSTAIQSAMDTSTTWSLGAISGTAGSAVLGGGKIYLPAKDLGYRLGVNIRMTKSKVIVEGPARINIDAGVTAMLFNYLGSSNKSGVVFRHIDFFGGATALDGGLNTDVFPWLAEHCSFINQTVASVITGDNGFNNQLYRCRFSGNTKAVLHSGSAADGLGIERCVFQYNSSSDFDIVLEDGANVAHIVRNLFIGNKAADKAHIHFDTTTANTGAYTNVMYNKFGPESRTTGNIIRISGSNPLLNATIAHNSPAGFDSSSPGGFIKVVGTPLKGCRIQDNDLVYSSLFDSASTFLTNGGDGDNKIGQNNYTPSSYEETIRGNSKIVTMSEPPSDKKYNILAWSRFVNAGGNFTYTNATPSYMTATDENGIANNATTVLATAANNIIQINSLDTSSVYKKYAIAIWVKLDTAGAVQFLAIRGSDHAFNKIVNVGTTYQRVVIEFYQTYLAAGSPYAFRIVIPNGSTITLGGVCCVPGGDVGDLRKTSVVTEVHGIGLLATGVPTSAIYFPAGTKLINSAPAIGEPSGWLCTVAGNPGTWVAEGALSGVATSGDADVTLTPYSSKPTLIVNAVLTADRAVTLSTTGALEGAKFRIIRNASATGAFNLNVGTGPLKALAAASTWCDVEYSGSAWVLVAYGTL